MKKIPISKPFFNNEEISEVKKVMQEGNLTNSSFQGGKRVQELESLLRKFTGSQDAIAINSGTAALHAALLALGIGKDDEVLLPSFTFLATANAVVATGAKPVFVDIRRRDYTIDPEDLERKATNRSKAVIPVHLYGHPADMKRIGEIANKHSLHVIEDACQSLGSTCNGKQTGSIGELGCFSFYASKVLTAGEGGAIVTNSKELADRLRMIRNHGMLEGYDTRIFGLNLRLTEINAAIAKVQMRKLKKMLQIRRKNAMMLTKILRGKNIVLPKESDGSKYNWYLYTVAIENRDDVMKKLNSLGIGATVYYRTPVHRTPFYSNSSVSLPNTEWAAGHVLSLPVHPLVTASDVKYIANSFSKML
ncbi:MAG: dTDP-4-amino-4,6-dideoxygalactose transaminase [Candidatus Nitrosomirales archaeon]